MSNAAIDHGARSALRFLKTTLVGGLVFLVPVLVLVLLVVKVVELSRKVTVPIAAHLPVHPGLALPAADAIVVVVALLACFAGGLLARLSFASRVVRKAETGVLWRVPGYGLIKALTDSLDKNAAATSMRPVLVKSESHAQLAFEVEQLTDGRRVVYIPSSPDTRAGSVLIVNADKIEPVPTTFIAAISSLRAMGRGMGRSLRPPAS
jgi:uncharacterized membrane protein